MADEPAYIRNFKELTKGGLELMDLGAFEQEAYGGSDRARAILLSSVAENALYTYLRVRMRAEITAGDRKRLFSYDGILGSFGARTTLAYSFGLISSGMKHELDLIRILRNGFAHCLKPFDFETAEVAAICAKFRFPDQGDAFIPHGYLTTVTDEQLEQAPDKSHPRTRFVMACHMAAEQLLVAAQPESAGQVP